MQLAEFQRLEQIKALYKQITPSLLVVAISVYTLSFIVLWAVYDKLILSIWYTSGIIITVLRLLSAKKFLRLDITIDGYASWSRKAVIWAFLSGMSWGFIYVFFASPDHFFRLLILVCSFPFTLPFPSHPHYCFLAKWFTLVVSYFTSPAH